MMILAKENGCFVPIVIKIETTKSDLTDMKHSLEARQKITLLILTTYLMDRDYCQEKESDIS